LKNKSFNIGTRLLFGFSIILILTIVFGIAALFEFKTLSGFTKEIHDHPMAVGNAVRDIKTEMALIQNDLQILTHETTESELREFIKHTHALEDSIQSRFKILEARYLGDTADVKDAHSTFVELRPVVDSILDLLQTGKTQKAIELKNENFVDLMYRLTNQVEVISNFSQIRGKELYSEATVASEQIFRTTIYFLILILILSIIIGSLISFSVTKPLSVLMEHIRKLAVGDQESSIEVHSSDEIGNLTGSLKDMQGNLREVVSHAKKIADGDYSGEIDPRSEKDELAISLNSMTNALKSLKDQTNYQDWIKSGQNLINEKMRGDLEIRDLASNIITSLANYVEAEIGAIYVYNKSESKLKMAGSYAYTLRKGVNDEVSLGEGLVGQSALEKKLISITDIPEDYIRISSGLGESAPRNIVAFPFSFESEVKGVIELGSFKVWGKKDIEFLENIGENIGISFNSAEARNSMKDLIKQQQEQAKELITQQEELRASNEELEEKTESLTLSEQRLKFQQEELRATNEELEEKTEFLENQRDEIDRKNQELEIVKDDIIEKARDLEASSRYKSEFLANMSHELRTPLNSLLILAKDLYTNKGDRLSGDDVKSAEIIYNSGTELLQLINEILDLAKIESGKMNLDVQNIPLIEMAEGVSNLFSSLAENKGISLNVSVEPDVVSHIYSDRQKLNQVIKNLVSNAVKFTKKGSVSIKFTRPSSNLTIKSDGLTPEKTILIEVKDSGIGIPENKLLTVFEAFKQADGSTSREFGGTGLGLSISRELASLLGGEIIVESEVDRGSTFSLVIPEKIDAANQNVRPDSFSEMETIREKSDKHVMNNSNENGIFIDDDRETIVENDKVILVIEDDRNFAKILYDTCLDNSFKSVVTDSGEKGLILAEKFIPDAIILDVKLPGMNGLQVLDHLKKSSITRHIPVHVMSGDDRSADVHDKGVLGFLQKPVDREMLNEAFTKIHTFIDKKVKDLLIVEDDNNLRIAIEKLIGNSDVVKTSVGTGKEAIIELEKNKFDCMILDLSLPDFTGNELLKKLDKMEIDHKPPVIIYTGREISYEEEFELRKYASTIIIKGVHSEERLLDETALFLHRVIKELPEKKQKMISKVYDEEEVFRDKKILIVDDDMRNIFAVSKILEEHGMIVEKAANGQKALDILNVQGKSINLVLMDIMMPIMDGYEAMREIRKMSEFDSLPVLALTAKAMKEDRHKCIEAGANDYMTKPIDPERLLSMMRVWLYK
jgi:signal transduction histidine kinase/CheY-like chemotaxis protein/HAMP domain-containing protein